jgi:pyrroloquinoline quinone (PQQ) biosynthesis protein C
MKVEVRRWEPGAVLSPQDAKAYVNGIKDALFDLADRKVTRGRFMQDLSSGALPKETLQLFWLNWHGFVAEINNFIQVAYQRHLGFFKRHVDLLTFFADKVADELIHPRPPGHIEVVWRQGEIFGLTRDQMIYYEMLPKCRALVEWQRGLTYEGTMLEFWCSILWEEFVGHWARQFREGLMKLGYPADQAPYFTTHEEADLEEHEGGVMAHGEFNRAVCERLLSHGYVECRPGFSPHYAALTSIELFALFLETCYEPR